MKTSIQENRRTLRVFQEAITNELGEYRLFWMAPGRYYVSAVVQPWQVNSQVVNNPSAPIGDTTNAGLSTSRSVTRPETTKPIGTGAADDEIYIPIYFPRSIDGEEAAPIDLQSGGEFRNVDISVAPVRTYHVRGETYESADTGGAPAGRGWSTSFASNGRRRVWGARWSGRWRRWRSWHSGPACTEQLVWKRL
jgi:hypothetical protein